MKKKNNHKKQKTKMKQLLKIIKMKFFLKRKVNQLLKMQH